MNQHYPFILEPLPYPYDALVPYIDARTLMFHHNKHLKAYVDNLNKTLEPYPEFHKWTLEMLLKNLEEIPEEIRTPVKNNAGGVYNHELYFNCMKKNVINNPSGEIVDKIVSKFGSFENWMMEFKKAALSVFGSGYAFLVLDRNYQISIITKANQDNPLSENLYPLLLIDVWEHAYYLMYQNRRDEYINNWFSTINWDFVNNRYLS